ncbi:hypothetical protein H4219_005377 [Mycoemilia scoparia]|uniref:Glutamine amidotransferase type-2 domain-containing protein n=1 Tax=Mycoemilia scoparia TaxID=417184 RepID=A0A9W7ZU71_9FUNG|nr:hypothetical protein H4219_005377 [Mycoemilia scoparia]
MCGIQLFISQAGQSPDIQNQLQKLTKEITKANSNRGPDYHGQVHTTTNNNTMDLDFGSHVLYLRGLEVEPQPIQNKNHSQDVFCWNGEIFDDPAIGIHENDGKILFEKLQNALSVTTSSSSETTQAILTVFENVRGPYAFIFYHERDNRLWFGRDCLGRRSLVWHLPNEKFPVFNSCDDEQEVDSTKFWHEVKAKRIYSLDMNKISDIKKLPFDKINTQIPANSELINLDKDALLKTTKSLGKQYQEAITNLQTHLIKAIRDRAENIPNPVNNNNNNKSTTPDPRVCILFSGGIDCTIIAALLSQIIESKEEPIELINVAFENPRQLKHKNAQKKNTLNPKGSSQNLFNVPDRKTGRKSFMELRKIDPQREWRFIEVNVKYEEVLEWRNHVVNLINPNLSVMEYSIGIALWFAARGQGKLWNPDQDDDGDEEESNNNFYQRKAKVALLGMGADEQFGGYSRHRTSWDRSKNNNDHDSGWPKLIEEIQFDVGRISSRNLGRDDRVVSDHGLEARFPFLAENVVNYISALPIHIKMDFNYERGIGDKLLLRLLAQQKLGLDNASRLAKRAIQFGARTAKMETSKDHGDDIIKF